LVPGFSIGGDFSISMLDVGWCGKLEVVSTSANVIEIRTITRYVDESRVCSYEIYFSNWYLASQLEVTFQSRCWMWVGVRSWRLYRHLQT
jgi:hypothetical protein